MLAARLQSLMWLSAQTDGRRNNAHGQTGHGGAMCMCTENFATCWANFRVPHHPPTERAVQTAGQDHLVLQLLLMPQLFAAAAAYQSCSAFSFNCVQRTKKLNYISVPLFTLAQPLASLECNEQKPKDKL